MSSRTLPEQSKRQRPDEWPLPISDLDEAVRVFLAERARLLRVAYRIVGDFAAAEDVVQEAWMRWQRVDRREIKNPAAFLTTATTHLAINVIQSARHRHELPAELPRVSGGHCDPSDHLERAVTIERTLGLLMAKLTMAELAALLLRKCFDLSYREVAETLRTTAPNARQLVRRAHVSTTSRRVRPVESDHHRRLVAAFEVATETGDLSRLIDILVAARGEPGRCASDDEPRWSRAGALRAVPARSSLPPALAHGTRAVAPAFA